MKTGSNDPAPCPIRVLVADDHPRLREGVVAVLDAHEVILVVAQAATGREAFDMWCAHRPDVALLDMRMPDLNGVEVIEAIRSQAPDAKIIVLTTYKGDVTAGSVSSSDRVAGFRSILSVRLCSALERRI